MDADKADISVDQCDTKVTDVEISVQKYLDSFIADSTTFDRIFCCETSSSLYCSKCCNLLVPDDSLPSCLHNNSVNLPFNLDIILDDRRASATGLHAVALLNNTNNSTIDQSSNSVQLIDVANNDEIPRYSNQNDIDDESTYLLFPSPGESIPLESVSSKVKTLVVLDCKWTKSSICRKSNDLSLLQKVHLSNPPKQSFYWRWHNAGPGMISTIEAIYYASFEVLQKKNSTISQSTVTTNDQLADTNNLLLHLLWLFGHQRAAILRSSQDKGKPPPFTKEGKEAQREMRRQKGTWRQLRHKDDERRLIEKKKKLQDKAKDHPIT